MKRWFVLCFFFFVCSITQASTDNFQFDSPEQEKIFRELITELRCPQCQNNNIAESNATISNDMRAKVYELIREQNYSKEQVVEYMVARYGNFVTYNPPVTPGTIILWLLPALALFIGVAFVIYRSRANVAQDSPQTGQEVEDDEQEDIDEEPVSSPVSLRAKAPRIFWIGVMLFLAVFTATTYAITGNWHQVRNLMEVQRLLPELKARAFDPKDNLSVHEMSLLALGLRSSLTQNPDSASDWMLLGSVYLALQSYGEASHAVSRAYALNPDDIFIKSKYAQFLVYSEQPLDVIRGERLLREVLDKDPTDIEAISALAFSAFTNHRYEEAINLWEYQLQVLPRNHTSRTTIERSIARARSEYEQQQSSQQPIPSSLERP